MINSKKKNIGVIFIFLLLILAIAYVSVTYYVKKRSTITQIDNPIVKCSGIKIPTTKQLFLYKDSFKRKHNFYIEVSNVLENINSVSVSSNKKFEFCFNPKPLNYMVVRLMDNGNYEKIYESLKDNNQIYYITTPNEPGKYIYSISAHYTDGLGIYYFSITVVN